jgi:predicted nuclease of predicted toxin-antitoxin system
MRFKVDENLPREICDLLNRAGHDAMSVGEQGLSGSEDTTTYERCQDEQRALITLDVGFANMQAYDPQSSSGVVVLRLAQQDKPLILETMTLALPLLEREPLAKRLWIRG